MDPWHLLSKWIKSNEDSSTPFAIAHGKPLIEYDERQPNINRQFNEIMASDSRLVISVVVKHCRGVFEGLKSLVDVGGGTGIVAKVIADEFLEMNCIVFDLSHVIEGFEGSKNLSYVGGNIGYYMIGVTPQTQGVQLAPNAKTQARADPAEPFATSAWQPHAIKKINKYISA
ncbi:hypothetical protein KY285_036167 [Solanum tuberosum]|nr:hypothetical protein KY285_036167 [Solanum tuberosum]